MPDLQGADNPEKIWNYLVGKGLSNQCAAGIMGNMQQESGFDPCVIQDHAVPDSMDVPPYCLNAADGHNAYGLCQWTGSRVRNLDKDAKEHNSHAGDIGIQLDFMMQEANQRGVGGAFYNAQTPEAAAQAWAKEFEGCGIQGDRVRMAREIFQKQGKGIATSGSYHGGPGGGPSGGGLNIVGELEDKWYKIVPVGGAITVKKLPYGKTMCEPIYPDYVTVSDTVPQWVLDIQDEQAGQQAGDGTNTQAKEDAQKKIDGQDGDSHNGEKGPNGRRYFENDIQFLMKQ